MAIKSGDRVEIARSRKVWEVFSVVDADHVYLRRVGAYPARYRSNRVETKTFFEMRTAAECRLVQE